MMKHNEMHAQCKLRYQSANNNDMRFAGTEKANRKAIATATDAAGELPPGPLRENSAGGWQRRMWWSPRM